jgi:hypothetical protein
MTTLADYMSQRNQILKEVTEIAKSLGLIFDTSMPIITVFSQAIEDEEIKQDVIKLGKEYLSLSNKIKSIINQYENGNIMRVNENITEQRNFMENIEKKDIKNVYSYTAFSSQLNSKLRNLQELDEKEKGIIETFKNIETNIPKITTPILLYRGMGEILNLELCSRQFISTSISLAQAIKFLDKDGCLIKITIPTGCKVIPIFDDLSKHPHEMEVLLPMGGQFIINELSSKELGFNVYDAVYLYSPLG